jgi:uncharacterized metal-binding protein YceD (DUF177 family)
MIDDFAHQLRLDQIHDGMRIDISADTDERASICRRLDLLSLDRLDAHAVLGREGNRIGATGRILASLSQACVATGEPVAGAVDEPFAIEFRPAPAGEARTEEIELDAADCDTVFHDGATIDLGAAIADTLALSLEPYPRSAGAEAALKEAGVSTESEAGPFGALAALREKSGDEF